MKAKFIISLLILALSVNAFNYINITNLNDIEIDNTPPKLDPELKQDLEEINRVKEKSKLITCMIIVRNLLSKGRDFVTETLKTTKFNKGLVFDKIVSLMISSCEQKANENLVEQVLNPENVLLVKDEYNKLTEFDTSILNQEPIFSEKEKSILKELQEVNKRD